MNTLMRQRNVFSGKKVSVYEYDLAFTAGSKTTYEMVAFDVDTGVSALPVDGDNILLIKHFQAGILKPLWSLPSGGLALGEDPESRMQLELQEEVGFKAGKLTLLARPLLLPGYIISQPGYLYLAEELTQSKLPGDEQYVIETRWMPFTTAMRMLSAGELHDARTVLGLFYYQQHLQGL